ncbi:MAG: hypothetical protein HYS98_03825 [Deltaproteobacteria bacterium]|nr:hypothetical protein [Deltaproteobacteria bacterium]
MTKQSGQVAILVLIIFTFLFLLFAMVINVGMTVHHKINLQNAADMAAYAGAAEQARILTTIGWKNFELRKNLKEMIYFLWVQHSAFNPGFPKNQNEAVGALPRNWIPAVCLEDHFNRKAGSKDFGHTGYEAVCRNIKIPPLIQPAFLWGPIGAWQSIVFQDLSLQREEQCLKYNDYNKAHAREDVKIYTDNSQAIYKQISDLALALNKEAQDTEMQVYNHQDFETRIPIEWLTHMMDQSGLTLSVPPLPKDIGVIARLTALKNLSQPNRMGNFRFVPVHPQGTMSDPMNGPYIKLAPMEKNFVFPHINFDYRSSGNQSTCQMQYNFEHMPAFKIGVRKIKDHNTYYAVRLASEPWLPFLPGALKPKLEAYAAAKPFGGRIGPQQEDPLLAQIPPGQFGIPNISLYPGDVYGMRDKKTLYDLSNWMFGGRVTTDTILATKKHGREGLRAPNQFEERQYTFNLIDDPRIRDSRLSDHPQYLSSVSSTYDFVQSNLNALQSGWDHRNGYSVKFVSIQDILKYDNPPVISEPSILH